MNNHFDHARRNFITGMLAASGLTVLPAKVWAVADKQPSANLDNSFLNTLCDLVIPQTDTPGAVAVKVPEFVEVAVKHGLSGAPVDALSRFEFALLSEMPGFHSLSYGQQIEALTPIDNGSFSRNPAEKPQGDLALWKAIKALIVTGYYTSQTGSSEELRYVLIPGKFDADVPADASTRAFSSDWTGVKFG